MEYKIRLNSLHDIADFVEKASKVDFDIDILQGRYTLNAKSLMAIFSLNLRNDITIRLNAYTKESLTFGNTIKMYLTEDSVKSLEERLQKCGIWDYQTN